MIRFLCTAAMVGLVGCAATPSPQTTETTTPVPASRPARPAPPSTFDKFITDVVTQSSGTVGRTASGSVYTGAGGGMAGQIGAATVRSATQAFQRWYRAP